MFKEELEKYYKKNPVKRVAETVGKGMGIGASIGRMVKKTGEMVGGKKMRINLDVKNYLPDEIKRRIEQKTKNVKRINL